MLKKTVLYPKDFNSSFLSCEKDFNLIIKKLFINSKPYSDYLKRLLVINTRDCIDNLDSQVYKEIIEKTDLEVLTNKQYIRTVPKISMPEHEELKSYIVLSMDNFAPNGENPEFRDCILNFDILCHTDVWDLGNFRNRPLKIAGYIDGILNRTKLTGIGTLNFAGCNELILSPDLAGYTLSYYAIHGSDDRIENNNG